MKLRRILACVVLAFVMVSLLCACGFLDMGNDTGTNVNIGSTITVAIYGVSGYSSSDFIDSYGRYRIPQKSPTKEGCDFVGWFLDEGGTKPLVAGEKASGLVSIYAMFEDAKINVVIHDEHNGNSMVKVKYGDKLHLADPNSEGYFFVGWFADEARSQEFDFTQAITKETEIYVGWTYASYNISYELNGGQFAGETPIVSYSTGDTIVLPKPSKKDYKFDGWYLTADFQGEKVNKLEEEKGDKIFYAKYICNLAIMSEKQGFSEKTGTNSFRIYTDYTAHEVDLFSYFDFSENSTATLTAADQQTVPGGVVNLTANDGDSTRAYDYSIKVTSESGDVSAIYMVTLYQYDEATLEVRYYVDGEIVSIGSVQKGGVITLPFEYTEEKAGYTFVYWEMGTTEYDFSTPVTDNIELTAVFTPNVYNLVYSLGIAVNSEENPTTFTVESDMLADPVLPADYTFVGWFLDSDYTEELTDFEGVIGDRTVYAAYTKDAFWAFTPVSDEPEVGSYEVEDTETHEQVTMNYSAEQYEITYAEYPEFASYCLANGKYCVSVKIEDMPEMTSEAFSEFLRSTSDKFTTSFTLSYLKYSDRVVISYNTIAPDTTSEGGIYRQLDFVSYVGNGDRESDFGDFAIDHFRATMDAETSEQLVFVLENGYRPNCVDGSAALTLYNSMRNILKEIIGKDWSEKDKVIAIAEYLVRTVAYDNATLEKFTHPSADDDLTKYRCFYLEGAILDKVAVCDGISKAFVCMCRIEGIKAIKVNGKHGAIDHAWNKVFIDADGNGTKEWYAVDCTGTNTGVASYNIEIVNHAFILTTDDYLVSKNQYVYAEKWQGKYAAISEYDIYEDVGCYVDDKATLQTVMNSYMAKYNELNQDVPAGEDKAVLVVDFCVRKDLVLNGNTYTDDMVNVFRGMGLSIDQINHNIKLFTPEARDDGYCILIIYIDK